MPESEYPCTGRITELLQGVLTRKSLGEWENSRDDIGCKALQTPAPKHLSASFTPKQPRRSLIVQTRSYPVKSKFVPPSS